MGISKSEAQWAHQDMRLLSGEAHLRDAAARALDGTHMMIAPSHVKLLKNNILAALPWKNDWATLRVLLRDYKVPQRTVLRYDAEGPGDTPADMRAYRFSTFAMKVILHRYIANPIGLYLNGYCNPVQVKASIKRLYSSTKASLKDQSILIYPFGNWFLPGTETFKKEEVMAKNGTAFEGLADRLKYDAGVKRGMAQLAVRFGAPVLPIYTTYKDRQWLVIVDKPIEVGECKDSLELTHLWLERQAAMQARIWGS